MATETQATTKVVTGKARFSYVHIFEPAAMPGSEEKKFSLAVLIPKSDKATLAKIKSAIEAAKEQGKSKWGGKIPAKLDLPLRDGDEEKPDDEAYAGHYFINAKSKTKPGIVDKDLNAILDPEEVYSGCYGRVAINFYPFDISGNKGVAVGLNNVQKLSDGEALGGVKSKPEDDFSDGFEDADDFLD